MKKVEKSNTAPCCPFICVSAAVVCVAVCACERGYVCVCVRGECECFHVALASKTNALGDDSC